MHTRQKKLQKSVVVLMLVSIATEVGLTKGFTDLKRSGTVKKREKSFPSGSKKSGIIQELSSFGIMEKHKILLTKQEICGIIATMKQGKIIKHLR